MGLLQRLFGHKQMVEDTVTNKAPLEMRQEREVPLYVPATPEETALVSVIATAIAAGDKPDSQFRVTKVMKQNPDIRVIAILAACLAAEEKNNSEFKLKRIVEIIE